MAKSPAALLIDSSGHEVTIVQDGAAYRLVVQTKVSNASGTTIDPATEGGNLASIKTKTDNIPSDPAREGGNLATLAGKDFATQTTLSALNTKIPSDPAREGGNLATLAGKDFATQTTLATLLTTSAFQARVPVLGQAAMAGSVPVVIANNQTAVPVSMASGGYGGQVEGLAADDAAAVGNPVWVAGWDGTLVRALLTDTAGRLVTVPATTPERRPRMIDLFWRATDGAIVANQFKRILTYTVPLGYSGYLVRFTSWQNESSFARFISETEMGTLNVPTNVFAAGSAYTDPQFAGTVEAEVTTLFGAANNITVTVTYTNQSGTAGRTGTFAIPKSSIVGTRITMVLQTGDNGVRSIQNLSAAPSGGAGVIKVLGFIQFAFHYNLSTTTAVDTQYPPGSIAFPEGTTLGLEYAGGTVAKERILEALIQLVN